jgi:hypothetical protein
MTTVSDSACPIFDNTTLISIYIVGMAGSLATYCTFVATFTFVNARETRDKNLCVGAWALLLNIIGSIIVYDSGPMLNTYPNPYGIVDVFFTISLLTVTFAAITRYTSELEGKPHFLINGLANGLAVVFLIFTAVMNLKQSFVPLMEGTGIMSSIMTVMPIFHVVLAMVYAVSRFTVVPPLSPSQVYFKDRIFRDLISALIATIWAAFLVFWLLPDFRSFRIQILMICQAMALIFELSITSVSLENGADLVETPKDNFFTSTMVGEGISVSPSSTHSRVDREGIVHSLHSE